MTLTEKASPSALDGPFAWSTVQTAQVSMGHPTGHRDRSGQQFSQTGVGCWLGPLPSILAGYMLAIKGEAFAT